MVEKKKVRKSSVKRSKSVQSPIVSAFHSKSELGATVEINRERHSWGFFLVLTISIALISGFIAFGLARQFNPNLGEQTTLTARISGGVCLTEKELRSLVVEQKLNVFWTGPTNGASYSLNASKVGQVFVRYVEQGQKCDGQTKDSRVIATYSLTGAFESTRAAGNQANGVSLENNDGSIVYFDRESPTNVYVAYPNIDYQIEIYDPNPKKAVLLATTPKQIQLITR